ncbi:MAG: nucleotidyltransferase domain-containing protein [Candidatus Woesearchaeota archaeon]
MIRPEYKIYNAYFTAQKTDLYFNELKELSGLSDSSLANTLHQLVTQKILNKKPTKATTHYTIGNKRLVALKFAELALRRFQTLKPNIRIPLEHFINSMPHTIFTILLFGSASREQERTDSDIDLLVVSDDKTDFTTQKQQAEVTATHPLSVFTCTTTAFIKGDDDIILQAKKTGIPIYKEQNFYEVMLDEYTQTL